MELLCVIKKGFKFMIIILTDAGYQDKAYAYRSVLLSHGIPASCLEYSYISDIKDYLALINLTSIRLDPENFDPERIIYTDTGLGESESSFAAELLRVVDRVYDVLFVKYGFYPDSITCGRYCDMHGRVKYCGKSMILTETERIIVKYLSFIGKKFASSDEIAHFCFNAPDNSRSVPVHIASINRKSEQCAVKRLIEGKRNYGYRLTER